MMSNEDDKPKKRIRRSRAEIEQVFFDAAQRLVNKQGFPALTITKLIQEANVEPVVFYNRYKDLDSFLDVFVRKFDYWLNDAVGFDPKLSPIQNHQQIISDLIDSFLKNDYMQKLLAWEMVEDNYITRRTAQHRDINSQNLIRYFSDSMKNCEANFNVSTAILIGGIYYLIIHRKLATFNNIDFSTKEGIVLLKTNMAVMIRKIFDDIDSPEPPVHGILQNVSPEKVNIIKELIKNKVDYKIIKKSTKLSDEELAEIYGKRKMTFMKKKETNRRGMI